MRAWLVASVIAAAFWIFAAQAQAQSIEETYVALCGEGQQSETCVALSAALAKKHPPAVPSAPADSPWQDPVWGPLAALAGTIWVVQSSDHHAVIDRFRWIEDGKVMEFEGGLEGMDKTRILFRPGRERGTLLGTISNGRELIERNVPFRFNDQGTLLSEPYRLAGLFGMGGYTFQKEITLTQDGNYASRTAIGEGRSQPIFPAEPQPFVRYTEETVVDIAARGRARVAVGMKEAKRKIAERERLERQESSQRWSQMMGAVNGALDAGLEVARAREAQSQYELDATLADLNARMAAEKTDQQHQATNAGGALQSRQVEPVNANASGSAVTSSTQPVRQCRTETSTYTKKSIPLSSRELAENHVRAGMAGACPSSGQPTLGSITCTEGSESVWGRDDRGVPKVTGDRPMYTCSAMLTCVVEVCEHSPQGGASSQ